MGKAKFIKMQGLGNDFIVTEGKALPAGIDLPALARRLCDRHFGIGGDGLILRWPSERGVARMQILNADGSEPEMCGNGLRCLVKYVALVDGASPEGLFETGAGLLEARLLADGQVRINMGAPVLEAERIPALGFGPGTVVARPLEADGRRFDVSLVSMGNPHCVIRVEDLAGFDFNRWGPRLESDSAFPARINVEFVEVRDAGHAAVKVWERGAGPTLACGTGACAVVVAGVLGGWLAPRAEIALPGGSLRIEWLDAGPVWMEGPAEPVFTGEIKLEDGNGND